MKKRYWCDILKDSRFLYVAVPVFVILLILVVYIVNATVNASAKPKLIKETEVAETYYDTYYALKYEQLVDVVNSVIHPDGTLNLRTLETCNYSLSKEKDKVVFTCEFTGDTKKKEGPYIITTTLSSNYEVLSQETNQLSKAEYTYIHLDEKVYKSMAITKFLGCCFLFGACYAGFCASLLISKKRKEEDLKSLQSQQ